MVVKFQTKDLTLIDKLLRLGTITFIEHDQKYMIKPNFDQDDVVLKTLKDSNIDYDIIEYEIPWSKVDSKVKKIFKEKIEEIRDEIKRHNINSFFNYTINLFTRYRIREYGLENIISPDDMEYDIGGRGDYVGFDADVIARNLSYIIPDEIDDIANLKIHFKIDYIGVANRDFPRQETFDTFDNDNRWYTINLEVDCCNIYSEEECKKLERQLYKKVEKRAIHEYVKNIVKLSWELYKAFQNVYYWEPSDKEVDEYMSVNGYYVKYNKELDMYDLKQS